MPDHILFRQRLDQLLQEEGIALRPGQDHLRQGLWHVLGLEERTEHPATVLRREGLEPNLVPEVSTQEGLLAELPGGQRVLLAAAEGARRLLPGDFLPLYRTVEQFAPTLIVDEADTFRSPIWRSAASSTPVTPARRPSSSAPRAVNRGSSPLGALA